MKKLLTLIFPSLNSSAQSSTLLLVARVIFGLLLAHHGLQKFMAFDQMAGGFPDPLGVGHELSLSLAIFGELVCSLSLVIGFLSRLVVIPMAFTMCVAFFGVSGGSIEQGELAFAYLVVYVLLFFAGPGRYSIDGFLVSRCPAMRRKRDEQRKF